MAKAVAKKKFGGKQEGAGRPKGSVSRRTLILRSAADNAIQQGKTPLDVMLRNMRFFDQKAEQALAWCTAKMKIKDTKVPEVLELLKEMSDYRMQAQKCAVDCAPFVHPRLSAIAVKVDNRPIKRETSEESMTDDQLVEYYNQLRMRPTSVEPLIIDNDTGEEVPEHYDEAAE